MRSTSPVSVIGTGLSYPARGSRDRRRSFPVEKSARSSIVPGEMTASQRLHEGCGCALGRGNFSLAGTERKYERSRPYRIEHLFVDLVLDFETKSVRGRAVLDFQRVAPEASRLPLQ